MDEDKVNKTGLTIILAILISVILASVCVILDIVEIMLPICILISICCFLFNIIFR